MTEEERIIQAYKTEMEYQDIYIKSLEKELNKCQKECKAQKELLDILKNGYMWLDNYGEFKKVKEWIDND